MSDPDPSTSSANAMLWAWLERYREVSEREAEEVARRLPGFAGILEAMPEDVRRAQSARSRDLQRIALIDGDWGPMLDDLRVQGRVYAQMGISFEDWYALLGLLRQPMIDRLPESRDETRVLLTALNAYLDRSMAVLGDTYVQAKQDLVRRAEEQLQTHLHELERSNRELDEFAYVASHDLKSPLQDIRNLAGWLAEDLGDAVPAESARHLALMNERVRRMERLLDDLLDYSRVGRVQDGVREVSLGEVVGETIAYLAPPPGFDVRFEGGAPRLRTPRTPLEKVLRNLIGNAIKHHDAPVGKIVVDAAPAATGKVLVRVTDDGPGIAPEHHDRVFRMFQTLKPRDQIEGSGVGLAIVKKTVEWFGGTVRIESEGRGTSVHFTWPVNWQQPGGAT